MRRTLPRFVTVALASCAGVAVLTAADTRKPATQWVARPSEAARVARVEAGLAPVTLPGEEPTRLSLQRWMELYKIPGLSIAVFEKNTLVWAKSHGVTQAGGSEPVAVDTLFQAASISKPVTALAALRYAEQGKWSLDANINDKLVSWKVPDNELTQEQKVTLRRVLSHTAGLTVHGFPGYAVNEPRSTLPQLLNGEKPANTEPVRVDITPGSETRYSSLKRRRSRSQRRRARLLPRRWRSRRGSAHHDWTGPGCFAGRSHWMSSPALGVEAAGGCWHS